MRECQLCGAKSWGPLEQSGLATFAHTALRVFDPAAYQQCDNCNMPALTEIIEKPAGLPDIGEIHEGLSPGVALGTFFSRIPSPDPMTVAKEALEAMRDRMPEPQTRLERLVRATLEAKPACINGQTKEYVALEVVDFARAIEREMDKAS